MKNMFSKISLTLGIMSVAIVAHAQVALYEFSALDGTSTDADTDSVATDLSFSGFVSTSGFSSSQGNPGNSIFIRSSGTDGSDEAGAVSAGDYVSFSVTPNSTPLALDTLSFDLAYTKSTSNPVANATVFLRSGLDGFSGTLGSANIASVNTGGITWNPEAFDLTGNTISGTTEFRLYIFDSSALSSDIIRIDNVSLTATTIPEPSVYAAGMGLLFGAVTIFYRRRRASAKSA